MGATNTTSNYNLSQFVGTDKPAWLQDYNGDMLKIDTGINAAKVAADGAQNTADSAQNTADSANSAITNTINPAISSLNTTVGNQGGAINTINSLIGNGTPTTTDQTIIGAINEINAQIVDLSSDNKKPTVVTFTVTTDSAGAFDYKDNNNNLLTTSNCRMVLPILVNQPFGVASAFFNNDSEWRGYLINAQSNNPMINTNATFVAIAWL